MTNIVEGVATNLVQRLIDGAIREVNYLCCFKTHVGNFEKKKNLLEANKSRVLKDIEDARKRNETRVEADVQLWLNETDAVISEDTKTNMKCFHGLCPNCIWRYRQGKKLAEKIPDIADLIERCNNFNGVARLAEPPGIQYYSPQIFIDFESRKSKAEELVKAIENENHYMIGLQGLGGTGKTTLATQVGEQIEESEEFQKVIFTVVSYPPDMSKIRQKIADQLELKQEEIKEEDKPASLWSRIANNEGKMLIILGDIWEWIDLRDIGIPCGPKHKNCCVLITSRDLKVCEAMGCQHTVALQTLNKDDALNLFIQQVGKRSDDSSNEFKDLAQGIANECGGIPLAIVAVATTIKGWSLQDWKSALKALQNFEPLSNVHSKLEEKVYGSLKLSYDHLEVKAKDLLLLCSCFPEDYEMPIDLLSKLALGLGLFGEAHNYFESRRKVISIMHDLIKSSLLLEAKKTCVKMHDLVREVILWLSDKTVQVIMNSSTTLKETLKFLYWSGNDLPNCSEATKLEILIIWLNGEAEVRDATIFEGMTKLKVLYLKGSSGRKASLCSVQSLCSLNNIQTLIFHHWELGDISILKNLKYIQTLELKGCSIIELPKEFSELKKLKSLRLRKCHIQRNNPFKVIERCLQLEELHMVVISHHEEGKPGEHINEVFQDTCPPMLQRYFIDYKFGYRRFVHDDDVDDYEDVVLLNCFNTEHVRELISAPMFKDLIRRAEVIEFSETGWNSLVEGTMMNDLIKLWLRDLDDIRYIIDRDMPDGSFCKLQSLKLQNCEKLQQLCFGGNLKLPHLKSLYIEGCPMLQPSIFTLHPSAAFCVEQLEKLVIKDCKKLNSLFTYESLEEEEEEEEIVSINQQKIYGPSFQKLKTLNIQRCGKLELVWPHVSAGELSLLGDLSISHCEKMEYIIGEYRGKSHALHQEIIFPSLAKIELEEVPSLVATIRECSICTQSSSPFVKEDSKEKQAMSSSRVHGCCFLPTTKDIDIEASNSSLQYLEATTESLPLMKRLGTLVHTADCLRRQPLQLQNIKVMTLYYCTKLKTLFNLSSASTLMLETLEVSWCFELKHLISNEKHNCDHVTNRNSNIFPKLKMASVECCNQLEYLFPSNFSGGFQKLQSIEIEDVHGLKYVFGASYNDQNINLVTPIDLPALKILSLKEAPGLISLCANKYYVVWPSLKHFTLINCWGLMINLSDFTASGRQELDTKKGWVGSPFTDFMSCSRQRQSSLETSKDLMKIIIGMQINLKRLEMGHSATIGEIFNVEGIQSERAVKLRLQEMKLKYLSELKHIYKDPNNILRLLHLKVLKIKGCGKLRALFTASTVKSLPHLSYLNIKDCKELVHIMEDHDNDETSACSVGGGGSHQLSFPMLEKIRIQHCDGLISLFSITTTSTMLPNLKTLEIKSSFRMKEVFRCPQDDDDDDDKQEVLIENVFPKLSQLRLMDLPELTTICNGINFHSVPEFDMSDCPNYRGPKNIDSKIGSPIEELQATHSDSDSDQTILDMGEAKREQEIEAQELTTSTSYSTENYKEEMQNIVEDVRISESSTVPSSSDSAFTAGIMKEYEDVHLMKESALEVQQGHIGKASTIINAPQMMNTLFGDDSIDLMLKERVHDGPISEDVVVATLLADLAPKNSTDLMKAESRRETIMAHQQELGKMATSCVMECFPEDSAIMKTRMAASTNSQGRCSQSGASAMSLEPGNRIVGIATASTPTTASSNSKGSETGKEAVEYFLLQIIENIQEDTTTMKGETDIPFIYPQAERSQSSSSTMTYKETMEDVGKTALAFHETSTSLDLEAIRMINKEPKDKDIHDGPKSEKVYSYDFKPNMPLENNTSLPDVIPSSHRELKTGSAGSSSPILEIAEIFQLVELKEGEATLLAKALELYPQLRLSCAQRPDRIIAFSYRALVDILVMLATKTPYTITASDRATLEANLSAANYFGFDKDWIDLVRVKVFGLDKSDVLVAEEKISCMEEELEKCDIALEHVQQKRMEAKEKLAMVQNEFEAIDMQLFDLLEHRRKLDMKIAEFRKIIRAKDVAFGI